MTIPTHDAHRPLTATSRRAGAAMRALKALSTAALCASLCALIACGDDPRPAPAETPNNDPNNTPNNEPNNEPNNDPNNTPNNDPNNTPNNNPGCQSDAECSGGRRCTSDGTCRARFDRGCAADEDCRTHESCQDVGGGARACVRAELPIVICPGAEGCAQAEGALSVGASKKAITPPGFEQPLPEFLDGSIFVGDPDIIDGEVTFYDCGLDQLCEGDPGYAGPDLGEGDGHMQGAWIAGFDHSRPALRYCPELEGGLCPLDQPWVGEMAHDDIFARAVAFRQGDTTVVFVVVDTVGFFYDEALKVEALLDPAIDVDLLVISATHSHEGPDTMGQWGPGAQGSDLPINSGAEPWWMEFLDRQIAAAVTEAVEGLRPATIKAAMGDTGVRGFGVQDSRDPWIFDDDLAVLQADDAETGEPIATILNWGNHAEALSDDNHWITGDFPGAACRYVEGGMVEVRGDDDQIISPAVEGRGGVAVFMMGSVGGLITPLRGAVAVDRAGQGHSSGTYEMSEAMGQQLAMKALGLLAEAPSVEAPPLRFATVEYTLPIENLQFHTAFFGLNLFDRDIYNATTDQPFSATNQPSGLTRASIVTLGNVTFYTIPGEIFPELLVGGYDPERQYTFTPVVGDGTRVECGADLLPIACAAHADCPADWACDPGLRACLPAARSCGDDNPCSQGADCNAGVCARVCEGDEGCAPGFACAEGACAFNPDLAVADGAAGPCMIRPSNENPPDLSAAPAGPYIKEKMPGDVIFTVGLGHDELGYIVPSYDFQLAPDGAYIIEAEGHHYEETNSTGPAHTIVIQQKIDALLGALPR